MSLMLIAILAFVAAAALVGGVALALRDRPSSKIEDRLDLLTGASTPSPAKDGLLKQGSILAQPLDAGPSIAERFLSRFGDFNLLFEQADTSLTLTKLLLISGVLAIAGGGVAVIAGFLSLVPFFAPLMASLPLMWLWWRRKRRLKAFAVQLPDALDMLARSLRAGQSLQAGLNLVSNEIAAPLGKEFGRVFEEQNLGIPLDETLDTLTRRVPNLDLKFFATAVILQRQTGGDMAEILDKIARLIRERFQIWGQVQALTGEGRLSGIVLMALPIVLLVAVWIINREYVMLLFTDPMGQRMLVGAVILQVLGALVIRKIVNIKV
jgi:tight adherence protein B